MSGQEAVDQYLTEHYAPPLRPAEAGPGGVVGKPPHDQMCPYYPWRNQFGVSFMQTLCQCALIARVRAEERERIASQIEEKADCLDIADYVYLPGMCDQFEKARDDLYAAATIARGEDA